MRLVLGWEGERGGGEVNRDHGWWEAGFPISDILAWGLYKVGLTPYISKKSTLCQIGRHCIPTQATSLLRFLRPLRPEFCCNAYKHYMLPVLPGNALYLLTGRRVVLTPCLRLSSGSLHFLLMTAPASHCLFCAHSHFSPTMSKVGLRPRSEAQV